MASQRRGTRGSSFLSLLVLAAVLLGAALAGLSEARAHASVVSVEPADGAIVVDPPPAFRITFSEPTSPIVLKLVRPDGSAVTLDHFVLRDRMLEIEAPADLGSGTHVLVWRTTSEDGHPVGGSSVFSIGAPSGNSPIAPAEGDSRVRSALWAAKFLVYVGLFIGVGGVFFLRFVGGVAPEIPSLVPAALAAGLVALPTSVGLQGLDALGSPPGDIIRPDAWLTGAGTTYGRTAAIAFAAFVAAFAALGLSGLASRILAAMAFVGIGAALAASGHASAAPPHGLMRAVVFLHATTVAFWTGALVPLAAAFWTPGGNGGATLRRFSRIIPFAIAGLVLSGATLAFVQVETPSALAETDYGKVLLAKLALLAVLFGLAAGNRYVLTVPAENGDPTAIRRLRRSIATETILVFAVLGTVALWRFTPPPRALAVAVPAIIHLHGEKAMAVVTIAPGSAGSSHASVTVRASDLGPLDPREVSLALSLPEVGIEPIRRLARRNDAGTFDIDDLAIAVPGRWTLRVDVLISDFEMERLTGEVEIRP